jgi:RimJ/RimL family protein N-acetyltransferase
MKVIYPSNAETNDAIAGWIMGKLGRRAVRPYKALGVLNGDGRLIAGAVFNGYNGANVDMTVYSHSIGLASRSALLAVFRFAFLELKATRVTVRTKRKNALHSSGMLQRLGFSFETCAARYYGKGRAGDAMVYRMLREDCRWIGESNGRRTRGAGPERDGGRTNADEQGNGRRSSRPQQRQPSDAARQPHL